MEVHTKSWNLVDLIFFVEDPAPLLLALQELDVVLVAVLHHQVQRSLPVPVPRLKLHCALQDFEFNNIFTWSWDPPWHRATRQQQGCQRLKQGGEGRSQSWEILWNTSEVQLWTLLGVKAWVYEHQHQARETLVSRQVQSWISIHGGQMISGDLWCSSLATFLKIWIGCHLFHTLQNRKIVD